MGENFGSVVARSRPVLPVSGSYPKVGIVSPPPEQEGVFDPRGVRVHVFEGGTHPN